MPSGRSTPAVSAARFIISWWPSVDQLGPAGGDVGRERRVDDRREQLALVELERVAPEQAVLEPAPVAVLGAVQVDEHVGHDHLARVVERLAQLLLAVGVPGLVVRR